MEDGKSASPAPAPRGSLPAPRPGKSMLQKLAERRGQRSPAHSAVPRARAHGPAARLAYEDPRTLGTQPPKAAVRRCHALSAKAHPSPLTPFQGGVVGRGGRRQGAHAAQVLLRADHAGPLLPARRAHRGRAQALARGAPGEPPRLAGAAGAGRGGRQSKGLGPYGDSTCILLRVIRPPTSPNPGRAMVHLLAPPL